MNRNAASKAETRKYAEFQNLQEILSGFCEVDKMTLESVIKD